MAYPFFIIFISLNSKFVRKHSINSFFNPIYRWNIEVVANYYWPHLVFKWIIKLAEIACIRCVHPISRNALKVKCGQVRLIATNDQWINAGILQVKKLIVRSLNSESNNNNVSYLSWKSADRPCKPITIQINFIQQKVDCRYNLIQRCTVARYFLANQFEYCQMFQFAFGQFITRELPQ